MSLFFPTKQTTLHIPGTGPAHDPERGHLFIVLNDPCPNKCNLLVSIGRAYPKCDNTCVLHSGHKFIKQRSFVLYAKADVVESDKLIKAVKEGIITYEGLFNDGEFKFVCDGILTSPHSTPKVREYYKKNCVAQSEQAKKA